MYNSTNLTRVSMPYNSGTFLLQDGSTTGGPCVYTYISTIDDIATIQAANYFSGAVFDLDLGDVIFCNGSDANLILSVSAINKSAGTVSTEVYMATEIGGVTAKQVQQGAFNIGTDTGTADNYIVNLNPAVTALTDGLLVAFQPLNPNATTTPTLQINSLPPQSIELYSSFVDAVEIGDIQSNGAIAYLYYSANWGGFVLLNPNISTAYAGNVQNNIYNHGVDTGSADVYVVNLTPGSSINGNGGTSVSFTPAHTNLTTAPTLNVNGQGNLYIYLQNGDAVQAGDLDSTKLAYCIYSPASSGWLLLTPVLSGGGGGGVTPIQIQENAFCNGVDSGVADAYVVTLTPGAAFTPQNGSVISFVPLNSNTTASPNIVVNGGALTSIFLLNDSRMLPGDFNNSITAYLIYDASQGVYYLVNPYISYATAQAIQNNGYNQGIDSGVADAYVVTLTPGLAFTPVDGSVVAFIPLNPNTTTAPTIAVNGGAPTTIYTFGGNSLLPGDIATGVCYLIYSSANAGYILLTANYSTFNLTQMQNLQYIGGDDTGVAANVYVYQNSYTSSNVFPVAGLLYIRQPNATNTGASTLNVNGVDYAIVLQNQNALTGGEISVNRPAFFLYGSIGNSYILLNPAIEDIVAKSIEFSPSTSGIIGVTDASDAGVGVVGEWFDSGSQNLASFTTSGVHQALATLSLTAGDWDIYGYVQIKPTAITSGTDGGLSLSNSSLTPISSTAEFGFSDTAGIGNVSGFSFGRLSINTTTSIYLVAQVTVSSGNASADSGMTARRVR